MNLLSLTDAEKNNPDDIISKMDDYFIPKTNLSVACHRFNTRIQLDNENFDSFLNELRKLAADCDFGTLQDRLIKDRIVCGIKDQRVKDRLLREADLTLTNTVNICKAAEQTEEDIRKLAEKPEAWKSTLFKRNSMAVQSRKFKHNHIRKREQKRDANWREEDRRDYWQQRRISDGCRRGRYQFQQRSYEGWKDRYPTGGQHRTKYRFQNQSQGCGRCEKVHRKFECPAFGKKCGNCNGMNHLARVCHNRNVNCLHEYVKEYSEKLNKGEYDEYDLGIERDWFQVINFPEISKILQFKLDTDAHINVIPTHIFL